MLLIFFTEALNSCAEQGEQCADFSVSGDHIKTTLKHYCPVVEGDRKMWLEQWTVTFEI